MESKLVDQIDILIYFTSFATLFSLALSLNTLILDGLGMLAYITMSGCMVSSILTVMIYLREPGRKWIRSSFGLSNGLLIGGFFPVGFIIGSGREDMQILLAILFIMVGLIGTALTILNYRDHKRSGDILG